jgi:hypothetical protein
MLKPIAVFYLPDNMSTIGRVVNYTDCYNISEDLKNTMPDYYWFVLIEKDVNIKSPYLKVFYEKDFSETTYEELKKHIESKIEEYKTK